jgi:hypothetical protein
VLLSITLYVIAFKFGDATGETSNVRQGGLLP